MSEPDARSADRTRPAERGSGGVRTVDTRTDPLWRRLVETRASDLFHAPAWHAVLGDTYGFVPEGRLLLDDEGWPVAGVAACRLEDLRGARVVGMPFSDFCDPLVDDAAAWSRLAAALPHDVPVRIRTVHSDVPLSSADWTAVGRARWHAVDLAPDEDALWNGLPRKLRHGIRKTSRSGVRVRTTTDEADLRAFFEIHLSLRRGKYRLLAQPYRFFEAIQERFLVKDRGTLFVAEVDGRPIAANLTLGWQDRLYYKFSASREDALAHRPNDLLMWSQIQWARERGYRRLDLGLSDWDQTGLVAYKRKYASAEGVITTLQRDAESDVASAARPASEAGPLLHGLTELFTDPSVPDDVTERAGALLYRFFA